METSDNSGFPAVFLLLIGIVLAGVLLAKKPPVRNPDQGDLFNRITTAEKCRQLGGDSWKGDSRLGSAPNGKLLGWCYKKQGWATY